VSELRSKSLGFNSWQGRYQVVTTWMGNCLRTDKPSRYIENTNVNSAFHPSRVGKSSTVLPAGIKARCIHLCLMIYLVAV